MQRMEIGPDHRVRLLYDAPLLPAWLQPPGKPLAQQMDEVARDLAARINAGLFDALDLDMQCDLRALSIAISAWGERVGELQVPAARKRPWWRLW